MKKIYAIAVVIGCMLFLSCDGPASDGNLVCECYEKAKENDDYHELLKCIALYDEVMEKYKDDEDAMNKFYETCGVF